ncbi:hypothetical protein Tsubulata_011956 [Turnera subulata]|uniref:Uncharacterized protein n=1 Tax=Turnera subulata TaxID=218843 RepID=A0A9Q0GL18_9ROSI|nr:hypothetical protein Tsubulata_011956 [Turnera subulata]
MGFPQILTFLTTNNENRINDNTLPRPPNPARQNLIDHTTTNSRSHGFPRSFFNYFHRLVSTMQCAGKTNGASRTKEEEKVYSWLYALAQSDKDLVFEYVQSTERGEFPFLLT